MADAKLTRKGDMIVLGEDDIRIEQGPKMVKAKATAELLDDRNTDPNYQLGGFDAYGYPIEEGKSFEYLDRGGSETEGSKCFYVYARYPLDPDAETLNGKPNPYYVAPEDRTPADGRSRSFMEYVFVEVGTAETEDEALELAQSTLADLPKFESRTTLPESHLKHLDKALNSPRRLPARPAQ